MRCSFEIRASLATSTPRLLKGEFQTLTIHPCDGSTSLQTLTLGGAYALEAVSKTMIF